MPKPNNAAGVRVRERPAAQIPQTMRAAAIDRFGGPDVLKLHTLPVPMPDPEKDDVIAIPKTSHRKRLMENVEALGIRLGPVQLGELDILFPPPDGPRPLEML